MPLAPLGCAFQLYFKPYRLKLWVEHSTNGCYLGTFDEHYRCHNIWVVETKAERVTDAVFFKHKYINQPTLNPEDVIVKALQYLKHAIKGTKNHKGNKKLEALVIMEELFNKNP